MQFLQILMITATATLHFVSAIPDGGPRPRLPRLQQPKITHHFGGICENEKGEQFYC